MPRTLNIEEKVKSLRAFYNRERRVPGYSEMMELFGYRSKNAVFGLLKKLEELGFVHKNHQGKITLTDKITGSLMMLGMVQAGFPSPAEEELVDTISLDEYLVQRPESTFMLTVSGDSMIDAGIQPGDIVLVDKGRHPKSNDIVVAQVDGEWTLKYFTKDRDGVVLEPANEKYHAIRPKQTLEIGGVVSAVVRRYP